MQIVGETFGKLRVLYEWLPDRYVARCECGNHLEFFRSALVSGAAKHCGCDNFFKPAVFIGHMRTYKKRGGTKSQRTSREYNSWKSMMQRAHWGSGPGVENYNGRGIQVCERWTLPNGQGFRNFLADMGPRPSGMTLDRKDVQGHHTPDNCKWATDEEQGNNRRPQVFPDGNVPPVQPLDDAWSSFEDAHEETSW